MTLYLERIDIKLWDTTIQMFHTSKYIFQNTLISREIGEGSKLVSVSLGITSIATVDYRMLLYCIQSFGAMLHWQGLKGSATGHICSTVPKSCLLTLWSHLLGIHTRNKDHEYFGMPHM